jgi:hypothetical protein
MLHAPDFQSSNKWVLHAVYEPTHATLQLPLHTRLAPQSQAHPPHAHVCFTDDCLLPPPPLLLLLQA